MADKRNSLDIFYVQLLSFYLRELANQKHFDEIDESFIETSERICLEEFKGLETYNLFSLNNSAHNVYDTFNYKKNIKDREEKIYLIRQLRRGLEASSMVFLEFNSLLDLFNKMIDNNLEELVIDSSFDKMMTDLSITINNKVDKTLDRLSLNNDNYNSKKTTDPIISEVFNLFRKLDKENYNRDDQDSINEAIESTIAIAKHIVVPYYNYPSGGRMLSYSVASGFGQNLEEKNYFETPETWTNNRVVRK